MNNAFVCTQGTSIANGCRSLFDLQARSEKWDYMDPQFEHELADRVAGFSGDALKSISAEINVLSKKGVVSGDKVVVLCSDGYLGRVCGLEIKAAMVRTFSLDDEDIALLRVEDLQVKDGERLSKFGLKNFIETARKAIEPLLGVYNVYLCPNGGYKGVVPFLTMLGLQYHCNVLYTFEFSNSLVTLPPLPYSFNQKLYLRARRALAVLTEKITMREEEYFGNIDNFQDYERDLFLGFVQHTDCPGYVTPSSLVDSFVNESNVSNAMLSDRAIQDVDGLRDSGDFPKVCRFIMNSQDPSWRDGHLHSLSPSTDLLAIKRTGNSPFRLLGFMSHGRYYVARVVRHGSSYEEAKSTQKVKDFPVDRFSLWEIPKDELVEVGDDLTSTSEVLEKNDKLVAENRKLLEENVSLLDRISALEKDTLNRECQIDALREELATANSQVRCLDEKVCAMEALNRRPWYKKILG